MSVTAVKHFYSSKTVIIHKLYMFKICKLKKWQGREKSKPEIKIHREWKGYKYWIQVNDESCCSKIESTETTLSVFTQISHFPLIGSICCSQKGQMSRWHDNPFKHYSIWTSEFVKLG